MSGSGRINSDMKSVPHHRSTLADQPDVREVLPLFIARLPEQVRNLRLFFLTDRSDELRRLAPQLKGSGKSCGFEPISTHAAVLEQGLSAGQPLPALESTLSALIQYIENIEGYNTSG
jgi:HPt (histidine-containing phosphotransfer) domain-containing protein